eukprot:gene8960-10508_t
MYLESQFERAMVRIGIKGFESYSFPSPIVPKIFYFFLFYAALVGLTLCFPPFITFVASPIWSATCDRYQCHRKAVVGASIATSLLIFSLYFITNKFAVMLIIFVNSFFWAPLIPILDSNTFRVLGSLRDLYGKQRMFGSISFSVSALFMGFLSGHMHNERIFWINYAVCMMIYAACTHFFFYSEPLSAAHIKLETLSNNSNNNTKETIPLSPPLSPAAFPDEAAASILVSSLSHSQGDHGGEDGDTLIEDTDDDTQPDGAFEPAVQQQSFFQSLRTLLSNYKLFLFLTNSFIISLGMSMINNFIAIVITEDFHGPSSLIGISTVLNVTFEVIFFFNGKQLVSKLGTKKLIIISHVALIMRVSSYIFLLKIKASAWCILPVELLHGIIFASIWNAGTRLCSELAPKGLEATSQSLLFGVYLGLGMGIGALVGGAIYQVSGAIAVFSTVVGLGTPSTFSIGQSGVSNAWPPADTFKSIVVGAQTNAQITEYTSLTDSSKIHTRLLTAGKYNDIKYLKKIAVVGDYLQMTVFLKYTDQTSVPHKFKVSISNGAYIDLTSTAQPFRADSDYQTFPVYTFTLKVLVSSTNTVHTTGKFVLTFNQDTGLTVLTKGANFPPMMDLVFSANVYSLVLLQ